MNKRRLRVLRDHLKTVPKKHFNLSDWVEIDGGEIKNGAIANVGCGTTACAMGWAASIPEFSKAGLKLAREFGYIAPFYEGLDGFEAARAFFDIDYMDAVYLFAPGQYPLKDLNNPEAVINRINKLLER